MTAAYRPSEDRIDAQAASGLLSHLGFLAGPDMPDRPGPAYLLVALRDEPTLCHYDPERIEYWVTRNGRGTRQTMSRTTRMPLDLTFSWGMIKLFDRLSVTNEYLTFGGHLSAAEVDGTTTAVFTSSVPLLRRGGHSQIWDAGTDELAAFFARLVAVVDVDPELEPRLAAADQFARYAAFLGEVVGRYRQSPDLRDINPHVWTLLRNEESLMRREHPEAWDSGAVILAESRLTHATEGQRGGKVSDRAHD